MSYHPLGVVDRRYRQVARSTSSNPTSYLRSGAAYSTTSPPSKSSSRSNGQFASQNLHQQLSQRNHGDTFGNRHQATSYESFGITSGSKANNAGGASRPTTAASTVTNRSESRTSANDPNHSTSSFHRSPTSIVAPGAHQFSQPYTPKSSGSGLLVSQNAAVQYTHSPARGSPGQSKTSTPLDRSFTRTQEAWSADSLYQRRPTTRQPSQSSSSLVNGYSSPSSSVEDRSSARLSLSSSSVRSPAMIEQQQQQQQRQQQQQQATSLEHQSRVGVENGAGEDGLKTVKEQEHVHTCAGCCVLSQRFESQQKQLASMFQEASSDRAMIKDMVSRLARAEEEQRLLAKQLEDSSSLIDKRISEAVATSSLKKQMDLLVRSLQEILDEAAKKQGLFEQRVQETLDKQLQVQRQQVETALSKLSSTITQLRQKDENGSSWRASPNGNSGHLDAATIQRMIEKEVAAVTGRMRLVQNATAAAGGTDSASNPVLSMLSSNGSVGMPAATSNVTAASRETRASSSVGEICISFMAFDGLLKPLQDRIGAQWRLRNADVRGATAQLPTVFVWRAELRFEATEVEDAATMAGIDLRSARVAIMFAVNTSLLRTASDNHFQSHCRAVAQSLGVRNFGLLMFTESYRGGRLQQLCSSESMDSMCAICERLLPVT